VRKSRFERGVACFSAAADNLLLWAHYADGHRGFCLEFDTSDPVFEKIQRVGYTQEWPVTGIDVLGRPEDAEMGCRAYATLVE
jgi:hypothetical protein